MVRTTLRMVAASLLRNRLQSGLTVLGVGIGIAAVMCTAALGAAGAHQVQSQIDALGEDFIWIRAGSENAAGVRSGWGGARTLIPEDAAAIERGIASVAACSPVAQGREQIVVPGENWNTRYQGVWPSFFDIRRRTVAAGTVFGEADETGSKRVLVLGQAVAERLFGGENPVGRLVRINRFPFTVIGVLESRGADRGGVDRDDVMFVPLSTALRTLDRRDWVSDIMCAVKSPDLTDLATAEASLLLRVRHALEPDEPDDFQIQRPVETLRMRAQTANTLTAMLTSIGAVSLIVGGVGIMNIMLVSVTERRREIGVRMAIGARVRDIRWQFLLEAAAIGLAGGVLGICVGWTAAQALTAMFAWPTIVEASVMGWAVTVAVGSGLLFGYLPAHQASLFDPIEAMRAEE
jgi:putative ABC transport system permease protein